MKKAISLVVLYFCLLSAGFSQQTADLKDVFLAAESYYLFEEFEEALPLYLRLHRTYPENYNLFFKIGVCYLNETYEKNKSIYYLEKASENINPKYKDSNFKESEAPLEALFFLGNAYRVNNKLDIARESYKKFQSQMDTEIYNNELVLEQLSACDAAENLMKKPIDIDVEILPNQLNTRFADKNPAISADETKIIFVSKLQFYDALFYSEKKEGEWSYPRNITPELGVDGDVYPTCLSYDGNLLFVYRNDEFTGNLYTSSLKDGIWTPLVKLNENINTKYWESHASLTKDGNTLYFTSNRKGGYGGLDIYKSVKGPDGDWGIPVNLGPTVNSAYNEETPFITENGNRLFFSSYGHYNMGGYDIFMSVLQADSTWATPENIGFPVNSTDDDLFFCPVGNGEAAYFPAYKETGYGKHDIYRYQIYTADHPRKYKISGLLDYEGETIISKDIRINVISQAAKDTLITANPDDSGRFSFSIPEGKYLMIFESQMNEKEFRSIEVNKNTPHNGITLSEQIKLAPLTVKLIEEEINELPVIEETKPFIAEGRPIEVEYEPLKGNQVSEAISAEYSTNKDSGFSESLTDEREMEKGLTTEKKKQAQNNITALLNDLQSRSEGPLKKAFETLDLKKEGIDNTLELFNYLYENTENRGYTKQEVDHLYIEMIGEKDLEEFLVNLKNASEGNLRIAISGLDLKANNISTPVQAIDLLVRNAEKSGYKPEDLVLSLALVGSKGETDHKLFINKLIQSSDEGALKVYLKTLDLVSMDPISPKDFAIALYRNRSAQPFTAADVMIALTNLGVNRDAGQVLNSLNVLVADGALKDFLTKLDLDNEGIYTSEQLIAHLYAYADIKAYTRENVDLLLQEYLYKQVTEIDDLRLKMAALATGNLKDFLLETDLNQHAFGSKEEFIDFLISDAAEYGFSQSDINNVLLKLSYKGDLEDLIKQFSIHSGGELKNTLEKVDLKKEGITTFDDLIQYLFDKSEVSGYSRADVYNMMAEYTSATDLKFFHNKLIHLADPETKKFLETLDLKSNGINDRSELVSFLLEKPYEGNADLEKILRLVLIATDIKAEDILPFLLSRSTGELNKLLNSGKLPLKDFRHATDLYDFLIAASLRNKSLISTDINQLFLEYLNDDSLRQFIDQLINHSDGNLLSFLQKLDVESAGITSVSELIKHLLNNAENNRFPVNQVFAALEKALGKARLEDFVDKLQEFAPPGLLRLLNQLDFDKAGISTTEDLLKYLTEHAREFSFTMDDVWDSVLEMVITGEEKAHNEQAEAGNNLQQVKENKVLYTLGIICLTGIFILLIILIKRKRKN